jgi:hypothetical protein
MLKNRGLVAEKLSDSVMAVIKKFLVLGAHADEGEDLDDLDLEDEPENKPTKPTKAPINYEQLIAQARKEEKDKLYGKIKKLQADKEGLVKSNNALIIKNGELMQELSNYSNQPKVVDSEEYKNLKAENELLKKENGQLKESTPNEEELRKTIEAELVQKYEVKTYLTEQISTNKDDILETFMDEVAGNTKEEIDASIEKAKEKTLKAKQQLGLVDKDGNEIAPLKKQTKRPPVVNPTQIVEKDLDLETIRNLDPRSPEYAEFRKKQGLR